MNTETHSLADWVRLRGGIKISEICHDDTEIRAVCSRSEAGYNLLNSKRGRSLDELTGDAIVEGWIAPTADHDDFLMMLGNDIQAKRAGNDLARVWHFSRNLDDLLDELTHGADVEGEPLGEFDEWFDYCGDCCSSCGNPESQDVWFSVPDNDPNSEWLNYSWHDTLCDACCNMLIRVTP